MDPFELYALRYAVNGPRTHGQNFIGGDPHEALSDLDFYVWIAKRSDRVFLIDTGSSIEAAERRKDRHLRAPADAIQLLGQTPPSLRISSSRTRITTTQGCCIAIPRRSSTCKTEKWTI